MDYFPEGVKENHNSTEYMDVGTRFRVNVQGKNVKIFEEKEEELKRMMIYLGRPGLHSDWVRFQVEARKKRQEAEKEREVAKEEFMNTLTILGAVVVGCTIFVIVLLVVFKGMKIL